MKNTVFTRVVTFAYVACLIFGLCGSNAFAAAKAKPKSTPKPTPTSVPTDAKGKPFWDEPYDAQINALIEKFTEGIAKGRNLEPYFALKEMVDNYDIDYMAQRLGWPKEKVHVPTIAERRKTVEQEIAKVSYGFSWRYDPQNTKADIKRVDIATLQSKYLKKIRLVRIDRPMPIMYNSASFQDMVKENAKLFGAKVYFHRTAMYEISGQYYLCPFDLIQFGNQIKIYSLSLGTIGVKTPSPLRDTDDYYQMIDDNDIWKKT